MRVLHLFKTYLPETVGGIEQVIFQICQSGIPHGVHGEVLTLSAKDRPPELMVAEHLVHRARLDLQLASTGFSYSVLARLRALATEVAIWPMPAPKMRSLLQSGSALLHGAEPAFA